MLLYVLKSGIEAIGNYHVYGAYEDPYEALANAVDLLAKDAPQVEIKWGQLPITKVMGL